MPLIKCPACGKDVSTQAAACPSCGHPLAKSDANKPQNKSRLGGLLAILLIVIAVAVVLNLANQPGSTTNVQNDSCRSDWTKCADNEQLVNQYSDWSLVQVRCKRAANDRAKYGSPDWPWLAFGSFYKGNNYVTAGIAVAIEPDAQFSNGFGAMVHSRVTCTYDLRANRVTDVQISPH
jgi:predicted nucleic acid-binding Zn ribbon protein